MNRSDPHCIVEITRAGAADDDGSAQIVWDSWKTPRLFEGVNVELVTNATSAAEIRFFDPKYSVIDRYSERILKNAVGTDGVALDSVRVFMGYGQNLGEPIFKGLLARVERGEKTTTLAAYDMGFQMKLVKRAGYKNKKNDTAILKLLTERNKLKFIGPDKPLNLEPHRAMMQDEQTDWEHALERARDAGLVLFVRQDTLFAKQPAKVGTPKITFKNRADFNLTGDWDFVFRTPENREGRPKKVSVRGRGRGGKRLTGVSTVGQRGHETVNLKTDSPGKHTKSKLTRRAQAQKELDREHAFEGHIKTLVPIETRLDVRETIEITNVGKLFSGKYLADTVIYEFGAGRFEMSLDLYRDVLE